MGDGVQVTELVVFLVLFVAITVMGLLAGRWKAGDNMESLDEWGLGGRKFGSWVTSRNSRSVRIRFRLLSSSTLTRRGTPPPRNPPPPEE